MKRFGSLVVFYLRCGLPALALAGALTAAVEFVLPWALRGGNGIALRETLHLILWPASLLGLGLATADRDDLTRTRLFPIDLRWALGARMSAALVLGLALSGFDLLVPGFRTVDLPPEPLPGGGAIVVTAVFLALFPIMPVLAGFVTCRALPQLAASLIFLGAPLLAATAALSPFWSGAAFPFWYLLGAIPPFVWLVWRAPAVSARQRRPWVSAAAAIGLSIGASAAYRANVEWFRLAAGSILVPHLEKLEFFEPREERAMLIGVEVPRNRRVWVHVSGDGLDQGAVVGSGYWSKNSVQESSWQVGQPGLVHFPAGLSSIEGTSLMAEGFLPGTEPGSAARFWATDAEGRLSMIQADVGPGWSAEKSRWWDPAAGTGRWMMGLVGGPLVLLERDGNAARRTVLADDFLDFDARGRSYAIVKLGPPDRPEDQRRALLLLDGTLIRTEAKLKEKGWAGDQNVDSFFEDSRADVPALVLVDRVGVNSADREVYRVQRISPQSGTVQYSREVAVDKKLGRIFWRGSAIFSFADPESPLADLSADSVYVARSGVSFLFREGEGGSRLLDASTGRSLSLGFDLRGLQWPRLKRVGRWLVVVSEKPRIALVDAVAWTYQGLTFPQEVSKQWSESLERDSDVRYQEYSAFQFGEGNEAVDVDSLSLMLGTGFQGRDRLVFRPPWFVQASLAKAGLSSFVLFDPENGQWTVLRRPSGVDRWLEVE